MPTKNSVTRRPARILIVDDHPVVREGMRQLVERDPDLTAAGDAGSAQEALSAIEERRPDLVTVDISLPGANGIELVKQIQARWPDLFVLVTSMHEEKIFAHRSLKAGARGYIEKGQGMREIRKAIHRVLAGKIYLSSEMTERALERAAEGRSLDDTVVDRLTDRELEVFLHLGRGHTTQEIAERLSLSPKTIESHREHLKTKLDIANANELVYRAVEWVLRGT